MRTALGILPDFTPAIVRAATRRTPEQNKIPVNYSQSMCVGQSRHNLTPQPHHAQSIQCVDALSVLFLPR